MRGLDEAGWWMVGRGRGRRLLEKIQQRAVSAHEVVCVRERLDCAAVEVVVEWAGKAVWVFFLLGRVLFKLT